MNHISNITPDEVAHEFSILLPDNNEDTTLSLLFLILFKLFFFDRPQVANTPSVLYYKKKKITLIKKTKT